MNYFKKVFNIITIAIGIGALFGGYLGTLVADRNFPVIQVANKVLTPEISSKDSLITEHVVERFRLCYTIVDKVIYDSQNIRWATPRQEFQSLATLGRDTYKQATEIPEKISPGPAKLIITITYKCNIVENLFPIIDVLTPMFFNILPSQNNTTGPVLKENLFKTLDTKNKFEEAQNSR